MIRALWLKKIWRGRSKGVSSVIGTVFLILVIFAISTNIFLWTISQSATYNQAVKDANQKNADRMNENVVATEGNCTYDGPSGKIKVQAKLTNAGPVAAQIINLWVFDTSKQTYGFDNSIALMTKSNMNPGQEPWDLTGSNAILVTVPSAGLGDNFNAWFVTARGNTVPVTITQGIIVAQLAQGIGSISMDFGQFKHYDVPNNNDGTALGPPQSNFTIYSSKYTVLGVMLTNLDPSHEDINLTADSYVWMITAHASTIKGDAWDIRKVQDNKLASFKYQILAYGKPTMVYFGATKPQWVTGVVPVNILLFGRRVPSGNDYGQNLPFIALRII